MAVGLILHKACGDQVDLDPDSFAHWPLLQIYNAFNMKVAERPGGVAVANLIDSILRMISRLMNISHCVLLLSLSENA